MSVFPVDFWPGPHGLEERLHLISVMCGENNDPIKDCGIWLRCSWLQVRINPTQKALINKGFFTSYNKKPRYKEARGMVMSQCHHRGSRFFPSFNLPTLACWLPSLMVESWLGSLHKAEKHGCHGYSTNSSWHTTFCWWQQETYLFSSSHF